MKQLMDYIVAALVLLLCWPLLLYIAIRIRMQGTGSIFYQQERLGKGGIPFRMVKFRWWRMPKTALLCSLSPMIVV